MELEIARLENIKINQEARELLNYGAAGQGYWTDERYLAQVTSAMAIAEFKYPKDLNTLVWLFDQSSCHCAYSLAKKYTPEIIHNAKKVEEMDYWLATSLYICKQRM